METITLKIKRPSLSSVLSGAYDNSGIRETVIAEAAQMFIDDPEAKQFLKDLLDRGDFEVEDSYQMEGIQYELLVADVVGGIFNKYKVNLNNQGTDLAINSVSDNGQSISYANEIRNYLANSTDNELFSGFAGLLNRYRRVNVVSYK